jgi:hypothetical protein
MNQPTDRNGKELLVEYLNLQVFVTQQLRGLPYPLFIRTMGAILSQLEFMYRPENRDEIRILFDQSLEIVNRYNMSPKGVVPDARQVFRRWRDPIVTWEDDPDVGTGQFNA